MKFIRKQQSYINVLDALFRLKTHKIDEIDKIYQDIKTKLIDTNILLPSQLLEIISSVLPFNNRYLKSYWSIFHKIYQEYHPGKVKGIFPPFDYFLNKEHGIVLNSDNKKYFGYFDEENYSLDIHQENTIYWVIMNDDKSALITFIEKDDFDQNQRLICDLYPFSENGYSLLEYCCYHGSIECFKLLRTKFESEITQYCLHFSFLGRNQEIIEECLKKFDPDAYCMKIAIATHNISFAKSLMNEYGLKIDLEDCYKFYNLEAFFIYLDQTKDINTCFVYSPNFYIPSLCEYLLSLGANINAKDKNRHTALYFASENGSEEIIDFLKAKGAKIEDDFDQNGINFVQNSLDFISKNLRNGINNPDGEKNIKKLFQLLADNFSDIIHDSQTESTNQINHLRQSLLEKHQSNINEIRWQEISRFFHQYDPEEQKRILNIIYEKENKLDENDVENANQIKNKIKEYTQQNDKRQLKFLEFIQNCYDTNELFGNMKTYVCRIDYFFKYRKSMKEFLLDVYSNEFRLCNLFKDIVSQSNKLSIIISQIIIDDNSIRKRSEYTFDDEGIRQFQSDKLPPSTYKIKFPLIYKNDYRTYNLRTSGIHVESSTNKSFTWMNILTPLLLTSIKINIDCIEKIFEFYEKVPEFNNKIINIISNKAEYSTIQEIQKDLDEIYDITKGIIKDEESTVTILIEDLNRLKQSIEEENTKFEITKEHKKNLYSLYQFREKLIQKNHDLINDYFEILKKDNFINNDPNNIAKNYIMKITEDPIKFNKSVASLYSGFANIVYHYLIHSYKYKMMEDREKLINTLILYGQEDDSTEVFGSAIDTSALILIAESTRTRKSLVFALLFFHLLRKCPLEANIYDDLRKYHLLKFMKNNGNEKSKNLSLKKMEIDYKIITQGK